MLLVPQYVLGFLMEVEISTHKRGLLYSSFTFDITLSLGIEGLFCRTPLGPHY